MSIFKAASLFVNLLSVPAEFFRFRALLEQLLQVKPRIRFIDHNVADSVFVTAGRARYDQNCVEINLSRPLLADKSGLSETLAHEMRHFWQRANDRKSFPLGWCQEKADWAKYWDYSEDQAFLLELMGVEVKTDSDFIGYLMSWVEVDARAYAAWFLYEREKGLPYVEPEDDVKMLDAMIRKYGGRELEDIPDAIIFATFLNRMFLAEARIQRAYVNAGLYDKVQAK